MFMAQWIKEEQDSFWFHVMTRGIRDEEIFLEARDYQAFLEVLAETGQRWDADIAAYCLVPDRYHLLIKIAECNLSECIHQMNAAYKRFFNQSHLTHTRLFQRRYRSTIVQDDQYLPDLVRYIHRIPVQEGMAERVEAYEWSSHRGYTSRARKWNWLQKDTILSLLAPGAHRQERL